MNKPNLESLVDTLLMATGNDKDSLLEKLDQIKEGWGVSSTVEGVE